MWNLIKLLFGIVIILSVISVISMFQISWEIGLSVFVLITATYCIWIILTNLTLLYLYENQLTGSIPSEIGNLTNLTYLKLSSNQLTGEIPESICDLNLNWSSSSSFNITNNQLCPPYPTCVEDYVAEQDTTNCN